MEATERDIVRAAVALARALRSSGLSTCVDQETTFCSALAELDPTDREQVRWAARAAFVQGPHEIAPFESVFERFWAGLTLDAADAAAEHGESDPRMPGPQHGGESLPQFRTEGRASRLLGGQPTRASREIPTAPGKEEGEGARQGILAAYSPSEVLTEREPLRYAKEELAALRRLAGELRKAAPKRRSRRLARTHRHARLDVRRTLRHALETDGETLRLAYASRSERPRRLVVLCDVSGSMERHSRALLASLQAVVAAGIKAEAFVFATRLTRLTDALASADLGRALDEARDRVLDWSGGTRIGQALADFNRTWGPRGLARGAIVIVASDGWDRGDPATLARELERLRLQCRRLVWLNPRPDSLDGQPLAVGMRAALPYLDDYFDAHDPRAAAGLIRVIERLDERRPARGRRPIRLAQS
jgi:uncharacterized protein